MPRPASLHEQTRTAGCWLLFRRQLTTRRTLLELTDKELADIGLDRTAALHEAQRPWWRVLRACLKSRELETNKAKMPEEAEFTFGK